MITKLFFGALFSEILASSALNAQVYQSMNVQSGFNADVIANGVGPAATTTSIDVDGVNFNFISKDFQPTSTSPVLTYGLPVNGQFNSAVAGTTYVPYQLANYSQNNSLRLATSGASGTLAFATPISAYKLFMLSTSGSGPSAVDVVVNFTDSSTQTFTGISLLDWYNGANPAISGFGRVGRTNDVLENPSGNPRLYQNTLVIDAANQGKLIQSVTITKTGTGAGISNIFAFSAEALVSCPPPTAITASGITANGAQISWTAANVTPQPLYDVYFSSSNTAPTSTTTPSVSGVSGTTSPISGLTSNTMYYVWVRSSCGGPWGSIPAQFTTLCSTFTAPYSEFFDTTSVGSTTNTNAPNCWSYLETSGFAGYGYVSTTNYSSPNGYYLYNSSATTGSGMLVSPPTTNLSDGTKRVRFYARAGANGYTVEVGTLSNSSDASTFTPIGTPISLTTTFTLYTVNIPVGSNLNLAFKHGMGGTFRAVYLDNITVENIPSCLEPTNLAASNIQATSVDFTWTASATTPAPTNDIYYALSGSPAPTAATTPSVTGIAVTSFTLSGLTPNTSYCAWVRSHCSATDQSIWSLSSCFTTACTSTTVPYTQNFEGATVPSLPSCTLNQNLGSGNNWTTASVAAYGFSSKVLKYAWNSSNAANTWFYTQGINLVAGTTYTISYKYGNNDVSTYTEKLKIAYGNAANSTAMTNQLADHPAIIGANAQTNSVDFTPTVSGVYYFGFNAYSIANQFDLYVDDISIIEKQLSTQEVVKKSVTVSPNPFTDFIKLTNVREIKSISVFDAAGRAVLANTEAKETVNLQHLKTGIYMLRIDLKNGNSEVHKIIKK